jgi:hypothetical protein
VPAPEKCRAIVLHSHSISSPPSWVVCNAYDRRTWSRRSETAAGLASEAPCASRRDAALLN